MLTYARNYGNGQRKVMNELPLWMQLENRINILDVDLDANTKSLLKHCRAQLENWFEANTELREENERLHADCKRMHEGLIKIDRASTEIYGLAFGAMPVNPYATAPKDYSAHANLMATAHSDPDYGKPTKPRLHVDMRA